MKSFILHSGLAWLALATFGAAPAIAQRVEITPFGGYRFGGDFFELALGQAVDTDGAPAVGLLFDVRLPDGLHVEGLFSHQDARIITTTLAGESQRWNVAVDHWQAGATQELRSERIRPFLSGLLGLTRYGEASDHELRFVAGGGGGVKLIPTRYLAVRLDGRLYATFVDVDARAGICGGATGCLTAWHADVVWQAEFAAGLVVRIP